MSLWGPPPPPSPLVLRATAEARREEQLRRMQDRRARIAAALLGLPAIERASLHLMDEDIASVACRIDREIEAITRGELAGSQP